MTTRGAWQRDLGQANKQRIMEYMASNPLARQKECAEDLHISIMAVSRHISALRAEWLASRKAKGNG